MVQDRSVYEDAEIFAHNLFLQGHLKKRDYETYRELYETSVQLLPPPDLLDLSAGFGGDAAAAHLPPRPRVRALASRPSTSAG